jgi:2'-5' RNA ligase
VTDKDYLKKNDKKRLFIAITLPEDIKARLFDLTTDLSSKDREIRPVSAANIHLTLKFLGDVYADRISKISKTLEVTARSQKSSSFLIGCGFEAFPDIHNARIIYVPVIKGADLIENFFKSLEDNLSKIKIRKESRKFISHITVARIKRKKDISRPLKNLKTGSFKECSFDSVTLFESILKPSGAQYIILDKYQLK